MSLNREVLLWLYAAWTGIGCVAQGCRVSVAMDLSLWKGVRVIGPKQFPVRSLFG
jgi:hypothetical protein